MTEHRTNSKTSLLAPTDAEPIAIVGMSLRVPGARTLEQFWGNIMNTDDCLSRSSRAELERTGLSPQGISDPQSVAVRPMLDNIEYFDADLFDIPESLAQQMDPSHRLFLECVWEAMEHAAIVPGDTDQETGVFAGVEVNEFSYLTKNLYSPEDKSPQSAMARRLGNSADYFALRVSYALNLAGPSLTMMATCATSLLAVHQAVQSLRSGHCSAAIAGGARIEPNRVPAYRTGIEGMFSPSGRVRPFDARADGTIFGDGVGAVVMKRLDDAIRDGNPIHSVILGSGYSNDGQPTDKQSFTAPAVSGQTRAIRRAMREAAIDPRDIGYQECHGTGTPVGDPIEVASLREVMGQDSTGTGYCALGSVKAHVGHLGSAAGVVGLIKTCLCVSKGIIPPVANFAEPNPDIDFETSPFYVSTKPLPWKTNGRPRYAGVSAFGFGGANAHVILGAFQGNSNARTEEKSARRAHLLPVSAKTAPALRRRIADLARFVEDGPESHLCDIAHTLQSGRKPMVFRSHLYIDERSGHSVSQTLRGLIASGTPVRDNRPVVFLFPGQGSQVPGMGKALYDTEPVYRESIDYCAEYLNKELGVDLREQINLSNNTSEKEARAALSQTYIAQPALFIVEYALCKLYMHWGLRPDGMLGHSLGELVAACVAGVFSLDTGLRLVALRSRLMQKSEPGSMAAIFLPLTDLQDMLPNELDLAAINAPTSNVVAGPTEEIERFVAELDTRGIGYRILDTSHAFHSRMLDATLDEFRTELAKLDFNPPTANTISNVTGLPLTAEQACSPDYWVDQRREPVKFSKGLSTFFTANNPIFVEVGPGRALTGLAKQHDSALDTVATIFDLEKDSPKGADRLALDALGKIWSLGADVSWAGLYATGSVRKIPLPTYPFQQNYHWKDISKKTAEVGHQYPLSLYEPGWVRNDLDAGDLRHEGHWLVFVDDQGIAAQIVAQLREEASSVTLVEVGGGYQKISDNHYAIEPGSRNHIQRMLSELSLEEHQKLRVLHFWTFSGEKTPATDLEAFRQSRDKGFDTLIALTQAAHAEGVSGNLTIQIYANGLAQVDQSTDVIHPDKGTLLGPCLVIPREVPGLAIRCIDIPGNPYTGSDRSLIGDIFAESAVDSEHSVTALRPEGRYREELFELPEIARGLPHLRYGATVLITGGVGGLGLKIAEHLHGTLNCRLVLTSRWEPPPRKEWSTHENQATKIGRALGVISPMVNKGADVLIVRADVSNRADMERVVKEAKKTFGSIHGIVHAAGILEDGPVLRKTREETATVLTAKVESAYILEDLFENQPLDAVVYFSSQASRLPNKGQVDYSAANAVLDRLAQRRRSKTSGFACAIGWGAWRETGMAWEYGGSNIKLSSLFTNKDGVEFTGETQEASHQLLKSHRRYVDGDTLFSGSIVQGEHWITTEHIVDIPEHIIKGGVVISATTVWEMFRAGFALLVPDAEAVELNRILMLDMFMVRGTTDYEILYVKHGDGYKVELRSCIRGTGNTWNTNATATVRAIPTKTGMDAGIMKQLLAVGKRDVGPCQRANHGPRWHCDWIGQLDEAGNGMASRACLQPEFHDEVNAFGMHPAILDRSIHNITTANDWLDKSYLPYACDSLRVYDHLPAETLTYAKQTGNNATEGFAVVITDMSGKPIVEMDGYVQRSVAAVQRSPMATFPRNTGARMAKAMVLGKQGLLDSFEEREVELAPLEADEVRIDVKAVGLNFRDVLAALGQLPEKDKTRDRIGAECSGVVNETGANVKHVCPGDRVVAIARDCFATSVVAGAHSVTYLPESLTFVEGASIPITFLTVDYAFNQLAQLQPGERVLIHAAAGGVGLAAVQLAQQIGAEIYATAGHDSKRDYLRNIGVQHVMNSRSLDFVEEISQTTDGEGVDVVLNSLAGEFIPASISVLKPFGRFLEIGKRDIYADSKLSLYPFRNNLSYFGVDLGQFSDTRKEFFMKMFSDLMQRFGTEELRPSPVKTFPMRSMGKGFEFMAKAQHIGKIVFAREDDPEASDAAVDRFRALFGRGIGVNDGLAVFQRLISSGETPPYVMATAEPIADTDSAKRHVVTANLTRSVDTPYREPTNASEEILKQIWEKDLGIPQIGIDDDFIELGGDSINAIMIQTQVEEVFSVRMPLTLLFQHPSIAKLTRALDEHARSADA